MPSKQFAAEPLFADATKIVESDIAGIKLCKHARPLVDAFHHINATRNTAENRKLHNDQDGVVTWSLTPAVASLRGLQQPSRLKKLQNMSGATKPSPGSLSGSVTIFAPNHSSKTTPLWHRRFPMVMRHASTRSAINSRPWTEVFSKQLYDQLRCHGYVPKPTAESKTSRLWAERRSFHDLRTLGVTSHRPVITGTRDPLTIRAECHAQNRTRMSLEGEHQILVMTDR